ESRCAMAEKERDALRLQDSLQRVGDVVVLALDEMRAGVNDGDACAHPTIELAHLQPDVAAADHQQMARQFVMIQPVIGVDEPNVVDAVDRRHATAGSGIENDLRRVDPIASDIDPEPIAFAPGEAGVTANEAWVAARLGELAIEVSDRLRDDAFRACENAGEVDIDRRDAHAVITAAAREMGDTGGSQHGLRWRAAEVHARPAKTPALGERHAPAGPRRRVRQRRSRLATPHDHEVVMRSPVCHRDVTCIRWSSHLPSLSSGRPCFEGLVVISDEHYEIAFNSLRRAPHPQARAGYVKAVAAGRGFMTDHRRGHPRSRR
ncbi:MAG TPA: hypothetical protein VGL90_09080, partial [Casimicrobiaceae bacterium]